VTLRPGFKRSVLIFLAIGGLLRADDNAGGGTEQAKVADQYRLFPRDVLKVLIQGETDFTVDRRVDGRGDINLPLLGDFKVSGLTIDEIEALVAKRYVDAEIFVHPEVVVSVTSFSPREVVLLGQVTTPGKVSFPAEATSMSIVEAVASAGGFTRMANQSSVTVTRKDDNGQDHTVTLDVKKMISGHEAKGDNEIFEVQPGDIINVPERLF
jgi:polysaccharide export outer membrane protein